MLAWDILLTHSLRYGLLLSVTMSALILGSLAWRPLIWLGDAPAEVRAAAPPLSAADKRAKRVISVFMLLLLSLIFGAAFLTLRELSGGTLAFGDAALTTFLIFMTFNVVDLLLIDWLLVVTLRPGFTRLPGLGAAAAGDYTYHFRAFLKGSGGGAFISLLLAAIAVILL
jgi:hypothetical protein